MYQDREQREAPAPPSLCLSAEEFHLQGKPAPTQQPADTGGERDAAPPAGGYRARGRGNVHGKAPSSHHSPQPRHIQEQKPKSLQHCHRNSHPPPAQSILVCAWPSTKAQSSDPVPRVTAGLRGSGGSEPHNNHPMLLYSREAASPLGYGAPALGWSSQVTQQESRTGGMRCNGEGGEGQPSAASCSRLA